MSVLKEDLHLQDFGVAILAGLHLHGVTVISDRDEARLHGAFVSAFQFIETHFEKDQLRFWMTTHPIHGHSPDAHAIMNRWLGIWATKDSPGHTWRFSMSDETACRLVDEEIPGGRELWMRAAGILIQEAGIIAHPRSLQ